MGMDWQEAKETHLWRSIQTHLVAITTGPLTGSVAADIYDSEKSTVGNSTFT